MKNFLVVFLSLSFISSNAMACPGMKKNTSKPKQKTELKLNNKSNISFIIEGMHCESCSNLATKTILNIKGVKSANVDLFSKEAIVTIAKKNDVKNISKNIKKALTDEGFEVQNLDVFR